MTPLYRYLLLTTIALSGLILNSCKYKYKDELVTVGNQFSMTVPDYLSKDETLKPGAEFQYCNRFRNTYVVVFSTPKDRPFEKFYTEQLSIIKKAVDKPLVTDSDVVTLGGAKGVHTEIAGSMSGEMIYYSTLTLETGDKYYQNCIWTRGEDRKLKYGKDLQKILFSFKLLGEK